MPSPRNNRKTRNFKRVKKKQKERFHAHNRRLDISVKLREAKEDNS